MSTEGNLQSFYPYIVIGCGGIGSGTVYWLSKKVGKGVLGIEQFKLGHDNGGSQDVSRIIRIMYHDQIYTRLTPHTYTAWAEVERESGLQLVHKTGGLDLAVRGSPREQVLDNYTKAMKQENLPFERLTGAEIRARWPQWTVGDDVVALYDKESGLVDAALGNSTHIQLSRAHGATVIDECPVLKIEPLPGGKIKVNTKKGVFTTNKVIVTAGAWINHVLGSVGVHIPVVVTQEQVTYFATPHIKEFTKDKFPIYLFNDDKYDFYGLPIHVNSGTKIGVDAGGHQVLPETRNYMPDTKRIQLCREFCEKYLPRSLGPMLYSKTCLYTMTKDRDFVIDTLAHKGFPNIIVCCGAGHAYKFASLLGQILTDLATEGHTKHDIKPFTINREAITNPDYKPNLYMDVNGPSSKL